MINALYIDSFSVSSPTNLDIKIVIMIGKIYDTTPVSSNIMITKDIVIRVTPLKVAAAPTTLLD